MERQTKRRESERPVSRVQVPTVRVGAYITGSRPPSRSSMEPKFKKGKRRARKKARKKRKSGRKSNFRFHVWRFSTGANQPTVFLDGKKTWKVVLEGRSRPRLRATLLFLRVFKIRRVHHASLGVVGDAPVLSAFGLCE